MIPLNQPSASMDPLFMGAVFVAGLLSFFSPCTFPMLPVYIGLLTETTKQQKKFFALLKTGLFVLGLSTTFITLGVGVGSLGQVFNSVWLTVIGGVVVIILGLHQMDVFELPGLSKYLTLKWRADHKGELLTAYLLGITFSFGWTPCVGPVLGAVLVIASQGNQPLYGGLLMVLYTLGLGLPFIGMTLLSSALIQKLDAVEAFLPKLKKIGGVVIVLMGLLLLFGQMNQLTILANKWFG